MWRGVKDFFEALNAAVVFLANTYHVWKGLRQTIGSPSRRVGALVYPLPAPVIERLADLGVSGEEIQGYCKVAEILLQAQEDEGGGS